MDVTSLKHKVHTAFKGAAEAVLPVRNTPGLFLSEGVITPEEFVTAGDFLVRTCPTWSWESGSRQRAKSYLPPDKQFLVTRNVPCFKRPAALEQAVETDTGEEGDEWLAPTLVQHTGEGEGSGARSTGAAGGAASQATTHSAAIGNTGDDDVPDISELALEDTARGGGVASQTIVARGLEADEEDGGVLRPHAQSQAHPPPGYLVAHEPEDVIRRTRTYDVSITFDKYYATPRIWLVGYSESRQPLSADECLEDVSVEHVKKTVTVDEHPHTGVRAVSIHPCKHAAVMKSLGEQLSAGGKAPRVEVFLLIFLRFCQTAVPTLSYDFTVSI